MNDITGAWKDIGSSMAKRAHQMGNTGGDDTQIQVSSSRTVGSSSSTLLANVDRPRGGGDDALARRQLRRRCGQRLGAGKHSEAAQGHGSGRCPGQLQWTVVFDGTLPETRGDLPMLSVAKSAPPGAAVEGKSQS